MAHTDVDDLMDIPSFLRRAKGDGPNLAYRRNSGRDLGSVKVRRKAKRSLRRGRPAIPHGQMRFLNGLGYTNKQIYLMPKTARERVIAGMIAPHVFYASGK